jgi:hypothetical protein
MLIATLLAFVLNPLLNLFKFGLIEDSVSEIYILQVSSLVDENTVLEVTLEILNIEFQLS